MENFASGSGPGTIAMTSTARILIIAGSDSGGGAGIQADIKTVTMLGGHAMTAVTAITAQNTLRVTGVHPIPTEMILAQIDAAVGDIGVDAVKIGMVGGAFAAEQVAARLEHEPHPRDHTVGLGLVLERAHLALELVRRPAVVGVEERDQLAGRGGDAAVPRVGEAGARLPDRAHPFVP